MGPKHRAGRRGHAKQRRKQTLRKENPRNVVIEISDNEGEIVLRRTQPSKSQEVTGEAIAGGISGLAGDNGNPDPVKQTEQKESGEDAVEITDAAADQARMQRINALHQWL